MSKYIFDSQAAFADRRAFPRVTLAGDPAARATASDIAYDCRIVDISRSGAKVKFQEPPARLSDIVVRHDALGVLAGECVWQSGSYVGVRFATAIDLPTA